MKLYRLIRFASLLLFAILFLVSSSEVVAQEQIFPRSTFQGEDQEIPEVQWVSPVENSGESYEVSDGMVDLLVEATDNIAVERVWFYRWDSLAEAYQDIDTIETPPYATQLDPAALNPGWNQVFSRAYDTAGNSSEREGILLYYTLPANQRLYLPIITH